MHKTATSMSRSEFAMAIAQIAADRNIDPAEIYEAIKTAMVSAYRKQFGLDEEWHLVS